MAVTERLMGSGNFSLNFSQEFTPTEIIESIKEWGHIVLTPQEVDVNTLSDSDILSTARYTGIVLNRQLEEGVVTINGSGLQLYLGDGQSKGMVIAESKNIGKVRTYTNTTLAETLFNSTVSSGKPFGIFRNESGSTQAITQGTIYEPASTYIGSHFVQTALGALKEVSEFLNIEYKINANGTIDAGPSANLFAGVNTNPSTIVVKTGYGEDPEFQGVVPQGLRTEFDATDFVSRVDFVGEVGYFDAATDVAGEANIASNPYKDLHGNALTRVALIQEPEVATDQLNSRAQLMLTELSRVKKVLNLDLEQYEVSGDMKTGDFIFAFDPDIGFVDTSSEATAESRNLYEVTFRGQVITPIKVRVIGLTFPITNGMGVYFRDKDGNYTDLTQYVQFESGSAQVELGDVIRFIGDDLRFSEFSLNAKTAGVFSIPDLPSTPTLQSGTYLNATGDSIGFIRLTVSKPTNTDSSQITDGSHYRVRYKKTTDSQYSYVNFPFTGASTESLLIQDLTVGFTYDVGVAVVDKSGFKSMSSYDGSGEDLYTNSSSVNANYATNARIEIEKDGQAPSKPKTATIAAGPLRVQVTHYLGKDGTDGNGNPYGNFTLEGDVDHLDIHAVDQDGNVQDFTVNTANKIGEIRVTSGNLLQAIPVIGTIEVEDSVDKYFRVVAVDKSGNESNPSDGQSAGGNLIAEANISDATITTAKIGDAQITTAKIGDAQITSAKVNDLSADKLTSGSIIGGEIIVGSSGNTSGFIKSQNYSSGSAGWQISPDGSAEFQNATIRGTLNAADITAGTLNVNRLPSITTSELNFTPVTSTDVVASINASSEGITIDANKLTLTGVLEVGDDITSGTVGGISISSTALQSTNYSAGSTGFLVESDGDAFFNSVTVNNPIITLSKASSDQSGASASSLKIGDGVLYNIDDSGINKLVSTKTFVVSPDGTEDDPSIAIRGQHAEMGFFVDTPLSGISRMQITNGSNNVASWSTSDSSFTVPDKLVLGGSIQVGGSTGSNSQYIGKNSSGTLGFHNLPGGNDHPDSDHSFAATGHNHDSDYYSASAGSVLASSLSSHTGHATSLSLLSNTSSDDSGGLFVTSVSGFGIRRTNRAGTTMYSQHIYPKNSHSSWGGVYDIGSSPVQAYDDAYIGTVNENSDINIKENIQDIDLGLNFINALQPKKYKLRDFDYTNDAGETVTKTHTRTHYGFVAQDVKETLKSLHPDNYSNDAMFLHLPNDDGEYIGEDSEFDGWALRYRQIIAPLVKAVQELSAENEALKLRVEALEG